MEIRFYIMSESRNTINKNLGDYTTTFLKLKSQDVDVINPTLTLKFLEYPKFNYLHIPVLSRYYFIDDIFIRTDKTYELRCSVDVLQSFKDDILRGRGLITQGKNYNPYYGDFDSLENKIIDTYKSNKTIEVNSVDKVLITLGNQVI